MSLNEEIMTEKLETDERKKLRQFLINRFALPELRTLAFDLGVDYESFLSQTKPDFVQELIAYYERRNQLNCLLREIMEKRSTDEIGELLTKLPDCSQSEPNVGILQGPHPPRHFVERPRQFKEIKKLLLDKSEKPGRANIIGIRGIGGVGKSTLAAALIIDQEIQRRYKDGILWGDLGQKPDILSILKGWIEALENYKLGSPIIDQATSRLRNHLRGKRFLLVIDDVWNEKDLQPFDDILGPQSSILVTTRQQISDEIIDKNKLVELPVMETNEALALMSKRGGDEIAKEEKLAKEIAEELGYLPLAIELAGAKIRQSENLDDFYQLWQEKKLSLFRGETGFFSRRDLLFSFELSLNSLQEEEKLRYLKLVVFPRGKAFPANAASKLWGINPKKANFILHKFVDQALLKHKKVGSDDFYFFHDLLKDLATEYLKDSDQIEDLTEIQTSLLKAYQKSTENNLWHTLPDDDYIHRNLIWHLEKTEDYAVIYQILTEETEDGQNGWYHVRERKGEVEGYLSDVFHAWNLVEKQVESLSVSQQIVHQFQYALIASSLRSLANNITPNLLAALVTTKRWLPNQAIAYTRQIPDRQRQTETFAQLAPCLAKSGHVKEALTIMNLMEEERKVTSNLEILPSRRLETLVELAAHSSRARELALTEVEKLRNTESRAEYFLKLAINLSDYKLVERAKAETEKIKLAENSKLKEKHYNQMLAMITPYLNEEPRKEALDHLPTISDDSQKETLLLAIASSTNEKRILNELLQIALKIKDLSKRASTLSKLFEFLTPSLKKLALKHWLKATGLTNKNDKDAFWEKFELNIEKIVDIAIANDQVEQALSNVKRLKRKNTRVAMIARLIPHLNELKKKTEIRNALQISLQIDTVWTKINTLQLLIETNELSRELKEKALSEAYDSAQTIEDEWIRAKIILDFVKHDPDENRKRQLIEEAHKSVSQIEHDESRLKALEKLITQLTNIGHPEQALTIARLIEDTVDRQSTLSRLAQQLLNLGYPKDALAFHEEVNWDLLKNGDSKWIDLAFQVGLLPKSSQGIEQQKTDKRNLDQSQQIEIYKKIANQLIKLESIEQALKLARSIENLEHRIVLLVELAKFFIESHKEKALDLAIDTMNEHNKVEYNVKLLIELSHKLNDSLKVKAQREIIRQTKEIRSHVIQARF